MGLHNITIPEREIPVGKEGRVTVRAISLTDIMLLLDKHGPVMAQIFAKVQSEDQLATKDVKLMIGSLAKEFPDLAVALMAVAADSYDDDSIATLKRIGINPQIEIIEAIFELTFPTEAEVKKLLESVTRMMVGVSGALTQMNQSDLLIGIGESAAA